MGHVCVVNSFGQMGNEIENLEEIADVQET
jgi:hypothetical protein